MTNTKSLVLHHYASSPYAEKIRRVLAMKNLGWQSVDIPIILPRPDLNALTGGYRRTPVLQIGSDIFCDTALIISEIEKAFPVATLNLPGHEGLAEMVAQWTDRVWFPLSVSVIFGTLADHLPADFRADREKLSGRKFDNAAMKAAVPLAKSQWIGHLAQIERRLEGGRAAGTGAWLVGVKPGLVDVHAYMNVWFARHTVEAMVMQAFENAPLTADWFERMSGLKGQEPTQMSAAQAVQLAKDTAPRLKPASVTSDNAEGVVAGQMVQIAPDDYGVDWVTGKLVRLSVDKIIIERTDDRCGPLHVHFPRLGYRVKPA